MPKIGPNKVSIDPKAYAARVTSAKKRVAQIDPATKVKISEYFPKMTKEQIAKQAIGGKDVSAMEKRMKAMPKTKITGTASTKPRVSASMSKSQPKTTGKSVPKAPSKMVPNPAGKKPMPKSEGAKPSVKKPMPKVTTKPRIVQMPSKISPSKMTPAQKAQYLKNPERYDK